MDEEMEGTRAKMTTTPKKTRKMKLVPTEEIIITY